MCALCTVCVRAVRVSIISQPFGKVHGIIASLYVLLLLYRICVYERVIKTTSTTTTTMTVAALGIFSAIFKI